METQYPSIGKGCECTFGSRCQGLVMGLSWAHTSSIHQAKKHEKWEDVTAALAIGKGFPLSLERKDRKKQQKI